MCLPMVSWSSVALATPHANSNKVKAAFLIVSRRFQFSADTVKMLIEAEIRLNQRDPPHYVKVEIKKNETFKVEMKQQRHCSPVYWFPQPFIEFAMINVTVRIKSFI